MKKFAIIPIDNRPVCYTLFEKIANIEKDLKIFLPERKFLGDLTSESNIKEIFKWLKELENIDYLILSLDTIAYGGLIPSRRHKKSFEELKNRIDKFFEIAKKLNCKILATSSIMRISNNNINEEEPEYWNLWGEKIFKFSYDKTSDSSIPKDILKDYSQRRKCNFELNQYYLNLPFDTLIFSKDDTGQKGFNIDEAKFLASKGGIVKTGADEIPLLLFSKAYCEGKRVKIAPVYAQPFSTDKISRYEDISVKECVENQIKLAGASLTNENEADLVLYVNNFFEKQGDLVLGESAKGNFDVLKFDRPFFIADINNANGSDNCFVENFLKEKIDWKNFYGYSGWNTTANTLGSAVCIAIFRFLSQNFNEEEFKKLQFIRFADDWAYQANVRKSNLKDLQNLEEMKKFEKILNENFNTDFKGQYALPWRRSFEVEVEIEVIKNV